MSSKLLSKVSVLMVCLGMLWSLPAYAQFRAGIQGTVTDPTGAAIQGASVTVINNETNISRATVTSASGVYAIDGLTPGNYSIKVEKTGFKVKVLSNVIVASEGMQATNVQLELGAVAQSVTVTAPVTNAIDTETATMSGTISSREIQVLPSFGRDPFTLARLAPGVFGDAARSSSGGSKNLPGNAGPGGTSATSSIFQTENQVQIIANGARTTSTSLQINGVGVNSVTWGGAATITPNEESIQSVKIISNNYDAVYGRNNGAQMVVVSKNGTNQFHGSAFFKFHRPGLNAFQAWNGPEGRPTQRDTGRFNQFGGSIGGPIIHNKLFGFFSYETLRNNSTGTALGWYETPQLLQMGPAGSIAAKLLTFPGEGASFNQIVPETCSDAGIATAGMCQVITTGGKYAGLDVGSPLTTPLGTADPRYKSPGNFGIGNGLDGIPDVMFVQTTNPTKNTNNQYNFRIDYQMRQKDLLSFTLYRVPVSSTFYNGPTRAANLWHHTATNHAETAMWNHTFSATLLNAARFGVSGWYWNEIDSNPQEPWGLPTESIDGFAGVGLQSFGAPGPSVFNQATYDARDTVTKVLSSHMLQFGADINTEHFLDEAPWSARPSYNFRNLWDMVNDAPYAESANFNPMTGQPTNVEKNVRTTNYAFFAQDNYRAKPSLTLNLGLRWEYFAPLHTTTGNISNPILGSGPNILTGLVMKVGGNIYNTSLNNWGPQIGFAWSPNTLGGYSLASRFVLRGGFGMAYNLTEEAITLNGRDNPPFVSGLYLTGTNLFYAVPANVHQFNNWPVNPAAISAFSPTTHLPLAGAPVSLQMIQTNQPTPVTYHYSLETQYEFSPNWVATLGYEGSQTRNYTYQNNLNWLYTPLNPRVNGLNEYINGASASFNALLGEIRHHVSNSFDLDAQYMWSRSIDEGSNEYFIDAYPFNVTYARSPSDYNATHSFKMWGLWTPNFFASRGGPLAKALGGWEISGIFNAHSGFPWTPVYGNTGCNIIYQGSGYCTLRPAAYLGGANTDHSNTAFMRNTGDFPLGALAYFTVPSFTMGPAFPATGPIPPPPGVSRNSFTGPRYADLDAMIGKTFGLPKMKFLGENVQFQLRADFYNLFNTLNLNPGSISNTISFDGKTSNAHFGQAQSALGGRIIELQAHFDF
ncbi:MAG: TonB-dependent receptor [Acidobacteriota bacterium]|nr:TonB-dependent receptor [Acidobacteriota bacterium]